MEQLDRVFEKSTPGLRHKQDNGKMSTLMKTESVNVIAFALMEKRNLFTTMKQCIMNFVYFLVIDTETEKKKLPEPNLDKCNMLLL